MPRLTLVNTFRYKEMYDRDLEDHVVSETSGRFKRLMVSMLAGGRGDDKNVDQVKAAMQAKEL